MTAAAALVLAALGTYAVRAASSRSFATRQLPPRAALVLRLSALGVMASLAVSSLPGGPGLAGVTPAAVVGMGASAAVARRVASMPLVMLVGVVAYAAVDVLH